MSLIFYFNFKCYKPIYITVNAVKKIYSIYNMAYLLFLLILYFFIIINFHSFLILFVLVLFPLKVVL